MLLVVIIIVVIEKRMKWMIVDDGEEEGRKFELEERDIMVVIMHIGGMRHENQSTLCMEKKLKNLKDEFFFIFLLIMDRCAEYQRVRE
jgi:hypothetical protein